MPRAPLEHPTAWRHTAVVLVASVDRRLLPALRFVAQLPQTEVRALHVSEDTDQARRVAQDWMRLELAWIPLLIREPVAGDLLASIRMVVAAEAGTSDALTVVVPELELPRWWHGLVHRRRARRIARHLQEMEGVTAVVVPFSAWPAKGLGDRLSV